MTTITIEAVPAPIEIDLTKTAFVIIDMQRDFLEPNGFGESLGNDVSLLRTAIAPCAVMLESCRDNGVLVIHTREGHRPDMTDAPLAKVQRGSPSMRIGDTGPMGRILIRGEAGHDIVDELAPAPGEPVLDKPGKGAFYQTDLELMLRNRGIETLLVAGVTTEVCVHTTVREANDRGFRCIVLGDCCSSYFPDFHETGLKMIAAQGGIFGWVSDSNRFLSAAVGGPAVA
jgi:nicotinamidase-related amidase